MIQLTFLALAAVLLIGQTSGWQQQPQSSAQETSPEPYSFSYKSDSIGGLSTHSESGDGSGRVTGFYTIQEEDGRERRVDYVADENGYRASVSTNEIGTRGIPTADVQYNVQPPSAKQLEAAKISFEQYKYLEEAHESVRERTSTRSKQANQAGRPQQGSTLNQNLRQSISGSNSFVAQQNPNQDNDLDVSWRQRQTGVGLVSSSNSTNLANQTSQQPNDRRIREPESGAALPSGPTQQQSSQIGDGSQQTWQTGRKTNWKQSGSMLQQQLEQQFLQQANQLSNQDYPRQNQPQSQTFSESQFSYSSSGRDATNTAPQAYSSEQQGGKTQQDRYSQQVPLSQQLTNLDGGQQSSSSSSNYEQQQDNIINDQEQLELLPEQPAVVGVQGVTQGVTNQTLKPVQRVTIVTNSYVTPEPVVSLSSTTQKAPSGFVAINLAEANEQASTDEQDEPTQRPQLVANLTPGPVVNQQQQVDQQQIRDEQVSVIDERPQLRPELQQEQVNDQRQQGQVSAQVISQVSSEQTRPAQQIFIQPQQPKPQAEVTVQSSYDKVIEDTQVIRQPVEQQTSAVANQSGKQAIVQQTNQGTKTVQSIRPTFSGVIMRTNQPVLTTEAPELTTVYSTIISTRQPELTTARYQQNTYYQPTTTQASTETRRPSYSVEITTRPTRRPQQQQVFSSASGVKGGSAKRVSSFQSQTPVAWQGNRVNVDSSVVLSEQQQSNQITSTPRVPKRPQQTFDTLNQTEGYQRYSKAPYSSSQSSTTVGSGVFSNESEVNYASNNTSKGEQQQRYNNLQTTTTNVAQNQQGYQTTEGARSEYADKQQNQWKGIKGGRTTSNRRQFWKQSDANSQQLSAEILNPAYQNQKQIVTSISSRPSSISAANDYASSLGYGSRLASRN